MAETEGDPTLGIGLIDGAIDASHPALRQARIQVASGSPGCENPASLSCEHGTFVAGLLTSDRQDRTPGICPGCVIVSRPIFCEAADFAACPVVRPRQLAQAIHEVLDRGVRIINMSVGLQGGGGGPERSLRAAYERARASGVLLIAAAGNQGASAVNPLFRHPWVIPVAAADAEGRPLRHSNSGRELARRGLLAPGADIVGIAPAGKHGRQTGTSMAAAIVTGAAALLWSLYPNASAEQLRRALLRRDREPRRRSARPLNLEDSRALLSRLTKPRIVTMSESITEPELPPEPVPTATATPTVTPTAASTRGEAPAQVEAPARMETPARLETPARIVPQACCAACAGEDSATEFAYAVGRLSVEFPDPSVRAEVDAQAKELGVLNTSTADYRVLSQRANGSAELSNLYLAKLARWVLAVDGVPTFSLYPRSTVELEELVAALAPQGLEDRLLVAIGPTMTGDGTDVGVLVNKVYYGSLQEHIARLGQITDADTVKTMFSVLQVESVPGDADEQRAKNFLAFRSREIYRKATDLARGDRPKRLVGAKVEASKVAGSREILDVRFQFKDDDGEESQWRVGVDVGGQFPFMTSKLVPFYG